MERDEVDRCIELLEAIVADRSALASLDAQTRRRLLTAAGRASRPARDEQRRLAKALRREDRRARRNADEQALQATGIRALRREPVFRTPPPVALPPPPRVEPPALIEARKCYVCKAPFTGVHHFYDQLCAPCGDLNFRKRHQSADLAGRVALVTGARVKIGYHAAIKLLRAGARVLVTTRFPRDAARRYAAEEDFGAWGHRLEVHGIDLRHTPSVEALARDLEARLPSLDFVLHNACQTVRRPAGFYAHLLEGERAPLASLGPDARALLAAPGGAEAGVGSGAEVGEGLARSRSPAPVDAPSLTQVPLLREDLVCGGHVFPAGALDADLQQVDRREANSWRMTLAQVPTVELLEVLLVNAIAPFVLNARLKPLMLRTASRDKHIVNVSAMEGQFYRDHKTDKHPHTNMAKAALNMMTRTSASDFARDGIHMNSVDTGWVTDEDPAHLAARKTREHGFHPPLDVVDGAARICDPIFDGFLTGRHVHGLFLKDYAEVAW